MAVYELPKKKSVPMQNLNDFTYLFYGERKIGKTLLASHFERPFFLFFEPGGRSLSLLCEYIPNWKFLVNKVLPRLKDDPDYCKTIVIDTGYSAYEKCFWYTMNQLGVDDPRDENWGNAWKPIEREFRDFHAKILEYGFRYIALAHSEVQTFKRRGMDYTRIRTELGKQAWRYYNADADFIGYYEYDGSGKRIMTIRGDPETEAGVRMTKKFRYTDGSLIKTIPLEGDAEGLFAFEQLKRAFNNELEKGGKTGRSKKQKRKRVYTRDK